MRVIGVDPGTQVVGWCVAEMGVGSPVLVDAGRCVAKRGVLAARMLELRADLGGIRAEFSPELVACEQMVVYRGRRGSLALGAAQSMVLEVFHGVEVVMVNIRTAKKAVSGTGGAGKRAVALGVQQLYGLDGAVEDDNVADAMALAWTGWLRRGG